MKFEVTILGSSSSTPIFNRNPSAQLLNVNEKYILIDCGEATQNQLLNFGLKANRIDQIFISHLHGDHYLGLVGLLSSLHLNGRTKPMDIFGPAELKEIIDLQFKHSQTILRYPINFRPTADDKRYRIFESYDVVVDSFPLDHRIPCTGFLFSEKQRLRKMIKSKIDDLSIPPEMIPLIKKGLSFTDKKGKVYSAEELTTEADQPKTYAYCSDTICSWKYLDYISKVDMLYHEATFMNDMLERAEETFHTTALQAGEVALKANAKKLLVGHFSARYRELEPLLEEAKSIFPETLLAVEGQTFQI
ncbi:MAG: ribonuclease Z [Sphingobacteriales bacterium 17-39-43]|uniref:ribonuclease Z n=1 Tax=Daejeonella sp. TaxID=2805397 RepID=UPI000BD886A6|nr:ribonuclease Z [Daejeonella sp.]OYZ32925.1 MAG: ribonuclease Z [Sphingobacteriales bacterium 16-39-50]OYZ52175.1 MAG: ribonuclease Z [Sphingobacteriales bacterium 24-40-4]OZA26335.1 MAG: ribonuclease Z [Sphingobacteriales bacterium 17-39-43]HQS06384.1 ribonuclease Z [Daejeonella sp.]HQT21461.1 ribonuclease Z [Daejeonella sp.]